MAKTIAKGITGKSGELSTTEKSAAAVGSGLLKVYSTPSMIALMEKAASATLQPYLDEGESSVGAEIHVHHIKATPLGMLVSCDCEIVDVVGRKITFNVRAHDESGEIGYGTHVRYIIDVERFMNKHA